MVLAIDFSPLRKMRRPHPWPAKTRDARSAKPSLINPPTPVSESDNHPMSGITVDCIPIGPVRELPLPRVGLYYEKLFGAV